MAGLNLSQHKTERFASEFPEPADIYLCDNCKRDITKRLSPGQSQSWRPMGKERYVCSCGQQYLTGAVEWEHLSDWERSRRIKQIHGLGILFSAMLAVPGLILYLLSVSLFHSKSAALAILLVVTVPFIVIVGIFWLEVAVSKLRTR
jgi:hypothetical protein